MLRREVLFLLSPALLAEYRGVLMRPKLVGLHGLTEAEVDRLLTELTANAIWREPQVKSAAPDPGDNHLWALFRFRAIGAFGHWRSTLACSAPLAGARHSALFRTPPLNATKKCTIFLYNYRGALYDH